MVNLAAIQSTIPTNWPANLLLDAAKIMLALSIAYLCYALACTLVNALKKETPVRRRVRAVCHALMLAVLYIIAALHLLEYFSLTWMETA